jgi:GT2 family glycosyltransferase
MGHGVAAPVLGIPCISHLDYLRDCVASIDAPVERLVIIDNSPEGGLTDAVRDIVPACVGQLVDFRPPSNLGYSGSLNALIKTHPKAPWWMYANADAVFAPGDMARVVEQMENATGPKLCGINDFRLFGLNFECVKAIGFWDEGFAPMYCEDTDYTRRMELGGVHFLRIPGATGHVGSATIKDAHYAERNGYTYPDNRAYYTRKWGGDIGHETFTTPFNQGGSLADWALDIERLRDNAWDGPE